VPPGRHRGRFGRTRVSETLTYYMPFPTSTVRKIRTINHLERITKGIFKLGGRQAALYRRHRVVRQGLHEHETALPAASQIDHALSITASGSSPDEYVEAIQDATTPHPADSGAGPREYMRLAGRFGTMNCELELSSDRPLYLPGCAAMLCKLESRAPSRPKNFR
jgi:hypothetical protein